MKFKEYLENLNKIAEEDPNSLNYDVIVRYEVYDNIIFEVIKTKPSAEYFSNGELLDFMTPNSILIN